MFENPSLFVCIIAFALCSPLEAKVTLEDSQEGESSPLMMFIKKPVTTEVARRGYIDDALLPAEEEGNHSLQQEVPPSKSQIGIFESQLKPQPNYQTDRSSSSCFRGDSMKWNEDFIKNHFPDLPLSDQEKLICDYTEKLASAEDKVNKMFPAFLNATENFHRLNSASVYKEPVEENIKQIKETLNEEKNSLLNFIKEIRQFSSSSHVEDLKCPAFILLEQTKRYIEFLENGHQHQFQSTNYWDQPYANGQTRNVHRISDALDPLKKSFSQLKEDHKKEKNLREVSNFLSSIENSIENSSDSASREKVEFLKKYLDTYHEKFHSDQSAIKDLYWLEGSVHKVSAEMIDLLHNYAFAQDSVQSNNYKMAIEYLFKAAEHLRLYLEEINCKYTCSLSDMRQKVAPEKYIPLIKNGSNLYVDGSFELGKQAFIEMLQKYYNDLKEFELAINDPEIEAFMMRACKDPQSQKQAYTELSLDRITIKKLQDKVLLDFYDASLSENSFSKEKEIPDDEKIDLAKKALEIK
ncbi:MAG: hypothetical protein K2W97_05265 [Chthoniobacterales bacterium]|nr:hypothetical protein [Chthoniobacterales bacterium]